MDYYYLVTNDVYHSQRMAVMGSMRAARMAGSREAALAMQARAVTEQTSIQGSRGDVS
jgi:hypothetical protein